MQRACIGSLMELAQQDSRVLYLTADSGEGGLDRMFRMYFPERSFDFGIAENNMVAAAAGLAMSGKIPFVFVAAPFLAYRSFEFIRNDICLQNLNVKLLAPGSGLSVSSLGPTHHTTEDVAVLRAIPNLMIFSPATPRQVSECVQLAYEHMGPVYIRIGMNREKEFYGGDYQMKLSHNDVLQEGKDAVVYVTGSILEEVQAAVDLLAQDDLRLKVVNVSTIKPFDADSVIDDAKTFKTFFTVEEHNIYGGLGSLIAEVVAYHGLGIKVHPIGLRDVFAEGYGTHRTVRQANALDARSIYQQVKEAL